MFDPACGSGNFLTEAYLSLRRLENDILRETLTAGSGTGVLGFDFGESSESDFVKVRIQQFYGIEINDFACAVAKTALWIAESQMFHETEDIIHRQMDFLPLKANSNIHEGNALQIEWTDVLAPGDDVKIMGNPPFVGASMMSAAQKKEAVAIFGKGRRTSSIDYVGAWYYKAVKLMEQNPECHAALVSTNSITQGEQVANLWAPLVERGAAIDFAYRTFRWDSEASLKAHVHVVVVGFSVGRHSAAKRIYDNGKAIEAKHINPYLIDALDTFIYSRSTPLCDVPAIGIGNQPIDGGNYLFTKKDMEEFVKHEPKSVSLFHPWYGSEEFIHQQPRYCLWLGDCTPRQINEMPLCKQRVEKVRQFRLASKRRSTIKLADRPTRFQVENMPEGDSILIPRVSSERRRYLPMGFLAKGMFASDAVHLIPNATLYHFGILESNVHMAWMRS